MLKASWILIGALLVGAAFAQDPSQTPSVTSPSATVVGGRAAGAGGTHAPGSTGTAHGTMGAQNTAPAGSAR